MRRSTRAFAGFAGMLLVAGATAPCAAFSQVQRASAYCLVAERAIRAGNIRKATDALSRALIVMPEFPAAHVGLGHVALTERRFEDALREYGIARDQYSRLTGALRAARASDYAMAQREIVELQDELRLERKFGSPPLRLSRLEAKIDRLRRMDPARVQAPVEYPAELDFYIGNTLFRLGRADEAIAAWETCIEKERGFAAAYQNLVVGHWLRGRPERAREVAAHAAARGHAIESGLQAELERAPVTISRTLR